VNIALALLASVILAAGLPMALGVVRVYRALRGVWLVQCPETRAAADVEIDAWRAASPWAPRPAELRLKMCSRWPAKSACGQECVSQLAGQPRGCIAVSRRRAAA
jgi:hypothetical protein